MKRFALLVFFMSCASAYGDCTIYEMSDVHEMTQEELVEKYCVNSVEISRLEKSIITKKTDSAVKSIEWCKHQNDLIGGRLKSKYKITPTCK